MRQSSAVLPIDAWSSTPVWTSTASGLVPEVGPTRPSVLFVGMLRSDRGADKGVAETVAACRRLAGEVDGLRLVMVGEGPLRDGLAAQAAALPFLCVTGYRPRREVAALMRDARVLVLASRPTAKWEEQFGYVLVEAMASGLPVVATRSGSIPEVVPEWNPWYPRATSRPSPRASGRHWEMPATSGVAGTGPMSSSA